jgi:hypothetical protein
MARRRKSIYGLSFFRELAIFLVVPAAMFFLVAAFSKNAIAALISGLVVAVILIASPLCRRVRRGVVTPFRKRDIWSGYYSD